MAAMTEKLTLADLEKLIEERQGQVENLMKKRGQLARTIERLDAEIQEFITTGGAGRRRSSGPRVKNETPLRLVVQEILSKNKKGLSLRALTEQVQSSGYKSQSRNLQNVVYQCVYHAENITHDDTAGVYRLKR